MPLAIKAENISKKYIIGHESSERYKTLRDAITNSFKNIFLKKRENTIPEIEEFWALKDINFEINQGDRIGIIGRNGAGKSTLLKILSRITDPTTGKISIKGRVASLLEVGTGFHPELTGRENIFLNGAILGMSKIEIKKKFDEIVSFAEVEKFLDTPVKRFSTGMYVRLAFSVAAHLEPEVLVIDEVLAVGDAQFQKKCLGKMEDVGKEGRTVIFVSHQVNAIEQLCSRCLLIEKGAMKMFSDDVRSVIKSYLFDSKENIKSEWINPDKKQYNNEYFIPLKIYFCDENHSAIDFPVSNDKDVYVCIELEIKKTDPLLCLGYALFNEDGHLLYWTMNIDEKEELWPRLHTGIITIKSKISKRFLNEGMYRVSLLAGIHYGEFLCNPAKDVPFVFMQIRGGLSDSPLWNIKRHGLLAPVMQWTVVE